MTTIKNFEFKMDATGCPLNLASFVEMAANHVAKGKGSKGRGMRWKSVMTRMRELPRELVAETDNQISSLVNLITKIERG